MKGIKRVLTFILMGILSFTALACNNAPLEETPTGDNVGSFGTYENLKTYLKGFYEENTNVYYRGGEMWLEENSDMDAVLPVSEGSTNDDGKDYSKTNNQVDGVQESDRILTDGYKIYIVSGNIFFIVDAETLNIEYTFQFVEDNENSNIYSYGYLSDMYLYEGKIILTSYIYTYSEVQVDDCKITMPVDSETGEDGDDSLISDYYYNPCVSYEYSYGTKIVVLDVSDTSDVTVFRELYFESASLISTRMINERIYLVLNNYMIRWGWEGELFIPKYMDSAVSNEFITLPADRIYFMPNNAEEFNYLMLVSFDVTANDDANVKAYLGSSWQIYMSLNNMYSVVHRWVYSEERGFYEHFTYVVRFEIENGELVYKALGEIEGSPLNQFSMDEYDGVFRIATTGYSYKLNEDDVWSWEIDNFLFCLDATTDNEMERLSVLPDLGKPGEKIYSVRFSGETGYIVTFQQIDPLYVIDISDPTAPVITGELEEEGVSDYLHEITDNLLLGIGRQAEEIDGWTRFTGVKVSLYDTTGVNPVNLETYLVEGEYSYTNVMWDHKAFIYFTPNQADFTYVAIPVQEYFPLFYGFSQSMYVFKVYHDGDLELLSKLTHMEEDNTGGYNYYDSIERAVMIENYIYTVSYSSIKMFDMNTNFSEVNSQVLNGSYYDIWGYPELETDAEIAD